MNKIQVMKGYSSMQEVKEDLNFIMHFLIDNRSTFQGNIQLYQDVMSMLQGFLYLVQGPKKLEDISLIDKLSGYMNLFLKSTGNYEKLRSLVEYLYNDMLLIIDVDHLESIKPRTISYNSPEYYKSEISSLRAERKKLQEELHQLKFCGDSNPQLDDVKDELDAKIKELSEKESLITKLEAEQTENSRIIDAITTWEGKITKAFEILKNGSQNIVDERSRLCKLYWGCLILSFLSIVWLGICEYTVFIKLEETNLEKVPLWSSYLQLFSPIPIAVGLLWGFITQMNRAQVQLVILSKYIDEIQYIEGILRAINLLSTNIDESVSKVNHAIERLLENHLSQGMQSDINEEVLHDKIQKDKMPYEKAIEIFKELSDIVSKSK